LLCVLSEDEMAKLRPWYLATLKITKTKKSAKSSVPQPHVTQLSGNLSCWCTGALLPRSLGNSDGEIP